MIVFTITNTITEQLYVGTSREDLDRRWEVILKAAEAGVEADLYDDIRQHGMDSFAISEWAFAEDTAELRELMQAALEETGGISLQGLKLKAPKAARKVKPKAVEDDLTRDALLNLEEQGSELVDDIPFAAKDSVADEAEAADAAPVEKESAETGASETTAEVAEPAEKPRLTDAEWAAKRKADKAAYDARQDQRIKEKVAKEKAAAREMALLIARMDARGKKPKKTAAKKTTKARAAAKPATAPEKAASALPTGRVNSAAKEKKIREAIAQEKDARIEERQAKQRAEAAEMAALIARLDSRAKKPKKAAAKAKPAAKPKAKAAKAESVPAIAPESAAVTPTLAETNRAEIQPAQVSLNAALDDSMVLAPVASVEVASEQTTVAQGVTAQEEAALPVSEQTVAPAADENRDCFNANGKPVVVSKRKTLTLKRRQRVAEAAEAQKQPAEAPVTVHQPQAMAPVVTEVAVTPAGPAPAAVLASPDQVKAADVSSQPVAPAPKPVSAAEKKLLEQLANQDAETTEMAKLIAKVAARKASLQATRRASANKQSAKTAASAANPVGKEQRLKQLMAEEKAKRQAKKAKADGGQSDEMAMLMARLEEKRSKCRR